MERSRGIESIRKSGHIEQEQLSCRETVLPIANTINSLIHTSPSKRPTASYLLNSVFNESNLERTFHKEEIEKLKQKIQAQETKIIYQNKLIIEQQAEIQSLRDIVRKYE